MVLERIAFPEPVAAIAVEPRTRADKQNLVEALESLAAEDPTVLVTSDPETNQIIVKGMGELHLEIILDRMVREFNVHANAGKPMVAYRETIRSRARGEHEFKREIGTQSHFAYVVLEVEPTPRSQGNSIEFLASANAVPSAFRPSVEDGINDILLTGVLGNFPVVDTKVFVVDGAFDDVCSSDVAFRSASAMAMRDAVSAADPVFLEPIMSLEITTPTEHVGDILADLGMRNGQIRKIDNRGNMQIIVALVPMAQLFGYATAVRSASKGRAVYTMEPRCFEVVSDSTAKQLLNR